MRIRSLVAGVAVAALMPTFALAQANCEQRATNRVVGTVAGAGIGALLGSVIAGHGDRNTGAVIGGIGGAVAGNQLTKGRGDCTRAYGYYDNAGAWHASNVSRANAQGYYDRQGEWVDGAPNGHYDEGGRWVRVTDESAAAGYYDSGNRWVPASANGYYDNGGRWIAGSAGGHYNTSGRWVAGPSTGRYDARGRWIPGATSARVTDVQPGYYENGRWHAEQVTGYYDTQGRWIRVDNSSYRSGRSNAPSDVAGRQTWLDERIRRGLDDGTLTRAEGGQALRRLESINREARALRNRGGDLRPRDEQAIMAKLDVLTRDVRDMRRGPIRTY
ncbi:glycine zipper 2TM domain-containing protein [uncultured Phenylobacterium sp.]|uniref:glycine zipper 2TM domain-containing protein n=1 Tax=uncultured Phenylobacterium sp. TaxID=349273 RepID=UPI0025EDDF42|nr:glycine zipper 2TM domain-containing protein [uncultured Phenylobacterium sp.]